MESEQTDPRVPEGAENPPSADRPAGGPDTGNQPPPPPAESDPAQDFSGEHGGERPQTNDNEMPDPAEESAEGGEEVHTGPPNPPESGDD